MLLLLLSASSPSTQNVTTTALSLNLADGTIKLSEGLAQLSPSVLAAFIAQYQGQTQTGRSVPAAGFILPTVPTTGIEAVVVSVGIVWLGELNGP